MTDASYTPPVTSEPDPEQLERERRGLDGLQTSTGLAVLETFDDGRAMTGRALGFIGADQERRFDDQRRRMFGDEAPALLAPEEANARYGVAGRLSFDAPVDRSIAEWRQTWAREAAFREEVVGNADLEWWQSLGASFAGSLVDPIQWPLWLVPEAGAARWIGGSRTLARLGPVASGAARGAAEGAAGSALYEGLNAGLHWAADDDYDLGAGAMNVIFGGVLGAGIGAGGGWWEGGGGRRSRAPQAIEALSEDQRLGAFMQGLDDMAADRPVDLTPVLRRAIERGELQAPEQALEPLLDALDGRRAARAGDGPGPATLRPAPELETTRAGDAPEGLMNAERWDALDDDGRLAWTLDNQLKQEKQSLASLEALEIFDAGPQGRYAAGGWMTESAVERRIVEAKARVKELEAVKASGRPGDDKVLRILAGVDRPRAPADAAPVADTARDLTNRLNAWYSKPGGAPGPAAAPVKDRSRPSRAATEAAAPARTAGKPKVAKGAQALPKGQPYADPEIAALAADTEAMLAREGLTLDGGDLSPQNIADAVAAGAACLAAA